MLITETPHTRIVSDEIFAAAQEILAKISVDYAGKKIQHGPKRRKYILSGIVECPGCGFPMKHSPNSKGRGGYVCSVAQLGGCKAPASISSALLERGVIKALSGLFDSPEFDELLHENLIESSDAQVEDNVARRQNLTDRIDELENTVAALEQAIFKDARVAQRLEGRMTEALDKIDALQEERAKLVTTNTARGFVGEDLPMLKSFFDKMYASAPYPFQDPKEHRVRDAWQSILTKVTLEKTDSRFLTYATAVFDFNILGDDQSDDLVFPITFQVDSRMTPTARNETIWATQKLVEAGTHNVSDSEFEALSSLEQFQEYIGAETVEVQRKIVDTLVLVASAGTDQKRASEAHGLTKGHFNAIYSYRKTGIEPFIRLLARLRPDHELALQKLRVEDRPGRHLRNRLAKISHPILELDVANRQPHKGITGVEWAVIASALDEMHWLDNHREDVVRSDLDAVFRVLSNNIAWLQLPKAEFPSPSNIAGRIEDMFRTGAFNAITAALYEFYDLPIPVIPKIPEKVRSKR